MSAYYNEIDPKAAAWLRELIARNLISPGDVDERSILDVQPNDIAHYTQCHFFAGIGVWSYALRQAGWPDDRPVWTGSCPCQPFSAAGRRAGLADERHLWPAWFWLIRERKPLAVFGEQVASRDGYDWLDAVRDDLEGAAYTVGALDLCAAGFGAPHIRQRIYFVADAAGEQRGAGRLGAAGDEPGAVERSARLRASSRVADTADARRNYAGEHGGGRSYETARPEQHGRARGLADAERDGGRADEPERGSARRNADGRDGTAVARRPGPTNGFWRDADWIRCRDGRWRPVKPGAPPLVAGAPARMGRLRGYGNAINAETARHFIAAYMEVTA